MPMDHWAKSFFSVHQISGDNLYKKRVLLQRDYHEGQAVIWSAMITIHPLTIEQLLFLHQISEDNLHKKVLS